MELNSNKTEIRRQADNKPADRPVENPETAEIKKIVEESKAAIQEEGMKPVKRRGRPPGSSTKRAAERPSVASQGASPSPSDQQMTPPPDMSPQIAVILKGISQIPAEQVKIKELALSDAEAMAVGQAFNEVIKAWIPNLENMSPKTASVLGLCMVCGSIGYQKYAIYTHVMNQRSLEMQKNPEKKEVAQKIPEKSNEEKEGKAPKGVKSMNPLEYIGHE